MNKQPFTFFIDPAPLVAIKKLATKTGNSAGWHIRKAVDEYLQRLEAKTISISTTTPPPDAVRSYEVTIVPEDE
jgi:hypothetical protein